MLSAINNLRISTKIMLGHAAVLICLLLLTSMLTVSGLTYMLYHQAEQEMRISVNNVIKRAEEKGTKLRNFEGVGSFPEFLTGLHRDKVMVPGVILHVKDVDSKKLIYGTEGVFLEEGAKEPLSGLIGNLFAVFADDTRMSLFTYNNFIVGCDEAKIKKDGHNYELRFFRIITAEAPFLNMLGWTLFIVNGIGILLALCAGYFISRRTLQPIRTITTAAREIEVADLGQRLEVPHVNDELSELMETFNRMLDRLQAGFEQQRRFVSDASHELRTPVTVISGYSEMLARWGRDDPETLDEGLSAIRQEAEDMQELIEKLLFLARADQKRQVMHKERHNMQEVIRDVAKKAKLVAKSHTFMLENNDEGTALIDVVLFKQMLRVFIENSLKYTPEGGTITLSSTRSDEGLLVTVADTGIGISEENQQRVFERFYRVDSSRTKSEGGAGGSGLGMSIASWIAEEHGIEISLSSELGKGTIITLLVPTV